MISNNLIINKDNNIITDTDLTQPKIKTNPNFNFKTNKIYLIIIIIIILVIIIVFYMNKIIKPQNKPISKSDQFHIKTPINKIIIIIFHK